MINDKQKGYLMKLFKSSIMLIGGLVVLLLSSILSKYSNGLYLMAIIIFILGFMDMLINVIQTFLDPNYFKGEISF